MPTCYSIDLEHRVVLTIIDGDATDADLTEHVRALHADPQFSPEMAELVDLSGVTQIYVTTAGIRTVAQSAVHARLARRAFIAPTDVLFGLSRMYQSFWNDGAPDELKVFRTRQPALEWVGLADALPLA
jgi:hypothetical protein